MFKILMLMALCIGPTLLAEEPAVMTFPLDIELDELDGASFRSKFFSRKRHIELEPGAHELVVHYYHLEDLDGNEHQTYRSPRITLRFVAQAGKAYRVGFTPPTQDQLETGGRGEVPMWIETESGQRVKEHQPVVAAVVDGARAVAPKAEPEKEPVLTRPEPRPDPALEPVVHHAAPVADTPVVVPRDGRQATVAKDQQLAGEMLRFWWEKASPAQREDFKKWLKSRPQR